MGSALEATRAGELHTSSSKSPPDSVVADCETSPAGLLVLTSTAAAASESESDSTSTLKSGSLSGDESSSDAVVALASVSPSSSGESDCFLGEVVQQDAANDEESAPGEGGGV